jgi:hypothetical protein
MPLPEIPTVPTQADYWRIDLEIRKAAEERCQAEAAQLVQYRADVIAGDARRAAAMEAQAAAVRENSAMLATAVVTPTPYTPMSKHRLVAGVMEALVHAWGSGTTPAELPAQAKSVVDAYEKLYPGTLTP